MTPIEIINHLKSWLSFDDRGLLIELTKAVQYTAYDRGFQDGLMNFAHNKDGALFVGTTGMTLREAMKERRKLFCYHENDVSWDQHYPEFINAARR